MGRCESSKNFIAVEFSMANLVNGIGNNKQLQEKFFDLLKLKYRLFVRDENQNFNTVLSSILDDADTWDQLIEQLKIYGNIEYSRDGATSNQITYEKHEPSNSSLFNQTFAATLVRDVLKVERWGYNRQGDNVNWIPLENLDDEIKRAKEMFDPELLQIGTLVFLNCLNAH